jgi:hypothetical protein
MEVIDKFLNQMAALRGAGLEALDGLAQAAHRAASP